MNKKIRFAFSFFLILLGGIPFAFSIEIGVPTSGIDWETSEMEINFTPEFPDITPNINCLGQDVNPIKVSLDEAGFSDEESSPEIADCLKQAGEYNIIITLVDKVGNESDSDPSTPGNQPYEYAFTVKASDVANNEISVDNTCNSAKLAGSPIANNDASDSGACPITFTLTDRFNNPVSQIESIKVFSPTLATAFDEGNPDGYPVEANEDTKFREGLRIEGTNELKYNSTEATMINESLPRDGILNFNLTAIAPSIAKLGTYLSRYIARPIDFSIVVPQVKEDGTLETAFTEIINSSEPSDIFFKYLYSLKPGSLDDKPFYWNKASTIELILSRVSFSDNPIVNGDLFNANDIRYYDELPPLEENDTFRLAGKKYHEINNEISYSSLETEEVTTYPNSKGEDSNNNKDPYASFNTKLTYSLDGKTITYAAGGVGLDEDLEGLEDLDKNIGYNTNKIEIRVVGVDVEGEIMGKDNEMLLQSSSTGNATLISKNNTKDIREKITENAIRLTRGRVKKEANSVFDRTWFDTEDVVIIDGGNVSISGQLPSGQKTLVIQNGNLVIEGDLSYADEHNDSFGVILINDKNSIELNEDGITIDTSTLPTTGNIFIREDVQNIVGAFYADGGFMSVDSTTTTSLTTDDSTNKPNINTKQLILKGVLFTKNTIGGSFIISDDGEFYTPWGKTTDKEIAERYDLHYVRQFTAEDYAESCAPAYPTCDSNENAFVIRIDFKVSELPPPGFKNMSVFKR